VKNKNKNWEETTLPLHLHVVDALGVKSPFACSTYWWWACSTFLQLHMFGVGLLVIIWCYASSLGCHWAYLLSLGPPRCRWDCLVVVGTTSLLLGPPCCHWWAHLSSFSAKRCWVVKGPYLSLLGAHLSLFSAMRQRRAILVIIRLSLDTWPILVIVDGPIHHWGVTVRAYSLSLEHHQALLIFTGSHHRSVLVPSCWHHSRGHGGGGLVVNVGQNISVEHI
jgi:hypothetical protein